MRNRLSRVHFLLCLVISICLCHLCFGQSTPAGSDELSNITYHSTASEVRLVFFATDEHNHAVESLQRHDFAVVDDGMVIRDFRSFTRFPAMRLDVVVLCDSSESVLPHFKEQMADVLQLISQWPWNPEDSVSVLSFSGIDTHRFAPGIAEVRSPPIGLPRCRKGDRPRCLMLLRPRPDSSNSAGSQMFGR